MRRTRQTGMDMVSGSMWDKILLFALPLAAGSMLQQLFNSVDAAVVGRFASSEALAAVGANTSVVSLFINLFVGISVGSNVVIANNIGKGKRERIPDVVHTTMLLAIVSGLLLLVAGMCVARPLLQLLSTPENVLDLAVVYLRLYCLGMPFIMTYNFAAAILRSKGDTKRPLYCLILSGCINAGLNILFVVGFHLSVAGVALATVIANVVSCSMAVYFLMHEEEEIRLHWNKLAIHREELWTILRIGIPARHTLPVLFSIYPISWIVTGVMVLTAYFFVSRKVLSKLPRV